MGPLMPTDLDFLSAAAPLGSTASGGALDQDPVFQSVRPAAKRRHLQHAFFDIAGSILARAVARLQVR
jgi:hypothetical protein